MSDEVGRLLYFAEHLAYLHARPDVGRLTAAFENIGEKAIGASLTVLALADEGGVYRPAASASPRPAAVRARWEALHIDRLADNALLGAAFREAGAQGVPQTHDVTLLDLSNTPGEQVIVAPVSFEGEAMGAGLFVAEPQPVAVQLAALLARHAAVALHQIRQHDEARRLHSVDPVLWVPDAAYFLQQLRLEVSRARRYQRRFGVALLRLDNESDVRQRFGDFFASHLLRRIGSQISDAVRDTDIVACYDGAFTVIHTETDAAGTHLSAERLSLIISSMLSLRFPDVRDARISYSVVGYPDDGATAEELVWRLAACERTQLAA